jgi:probable HAF family extracellular repeat protein
MKSRTWMWRTAVYLLAASAVTIGAAAQDNLMSRNKHHKYRLIDMGTLGGPMGYINSQGNGGPYINHPGAVVGVAQTTVSIPSQNNPYACFPGPNVNHAILWRNGHSIELPTLPPADQNCSGTNSMGINDRGDITYQSEIDVIDPLLGVKEIHSVVWNNGTLADLGTMGGNATASLGMNNRGQVVGFSLNATPDPYSFYGLFFEGSSNSTQTRAFLWQHGTMRDLGTLGGPDAAAVLVNNNGDVMGFSYTNDIPNETTGIPTIDPFLWRNGSMIDLGTLGGTITQAIGVNSQGQLAGQGNLAGDTTQHPFFWDRGHLMDLGTFGGSNGAANSLNDSGEVVGVADFPGDQLHHAFLWKRGVMTDLGTLGTNSIAFTNNSQGQVAGAVRLNDTTVHAFLWEKGGPMVDLNDLVSPRSDVVLLSPNAIGDNGEIAVNGLPVGCGDVDVCGHPYVLVPDGDADDDVEARIAASRLRAAISHGDPSTENKAIPLYSPAPRNSEASPANGIVPSPDRFGRPRLPGQSVTPRN